MEGKGRNVLLFVCMWIYVLKLHHCSGETKKEALPYIQKIVQTFTDNFQWVCKVNKSRYNCCSFVFVSVQLLPQLTSRVHVNIVSNTLCCC